MVAFVAFYILHSTFYIPAYAQTPTPSAAGANVGTFNPSSAPEILDPDDPRSQAIGPNDGWRSDAEVTYTGHLAARSEDTLNWLLNNYKWAEIRPGENPFELIFVAVRNTVYILLALFILAASFLMIVTRGRSLTVKKFIPRFIFITILVSLSFSIIQLIYYMGDVIQGFFITKNGQAIQTIDLLSVAFEYKDFEGFRRFGPEFNESAVMSLLLTKLTAATYYTMAIILIIRKIVLWFFIVVSPIFPLLLFFGPIRNTAKIWIGEFFRWLLYGVLFFIFLRGVVEIWQFRSTSSQTGIPLNFDLSKAGQVGDIEYPTAINIVLGGPTNPGLGISGANNINLPDTFALYIVALLMLWAVIIVPWILLKIFLDYMNSFNAGESNLVKFLARNGSPLSPLMNRYRPNTPPGSPTPPISPTGGGLTGLAKSLPMTRFKHSPVAELAESMKQATVDAQTQIANQTQVAQQSISETGRSQVSSSLASSFGALASIKPIQYTSLQTAQDSQEVAGITSINIPSLQDIVKFETAYLSSTSPARDEVTKLNEVLSRLSGTSTIAAPAEKEKFQAIRERLVQSAQKGNAAAQSVVEATKPVTGQSLPDTNRVQQVSLDDYEEVKATWEENFRKIDPPMGPDGTPMARKEWLKQEVNQIPQVIDLLLSGDPKQVEKGKQMVSKILPFLLLGGFSKAEIVAYLKAKLEAAKKVMNEVLEVEAKAEDEDSKVDRAQAGQAQKSMTLQAEIPTEEKPETNK